MTTLEDLQKGIELQIRQHKPVAYWLWGKMCEMIDFRYRREKTDTIIAEFMEECSEQAFNALSEECKKQILSNALLKEETKIREGEK